MIRLLYIDLFCGAGGTSTGVEAARIGGEKCAKVIACVNHDAHAIASHAANHPEAVHYTEDIRTLDIAPLAAHLAKCRQQYPGAKVVLWASLECTNFSKAKGGLPRDADSRTLAEHLFRYIEVLNPDYIQIENVEEFMSWGDMDEKGKPISRDKGRCYMRWVNRVRSYGYYFDYRILNAADFGAYTSRKRFFAIFEDDSPMTRRIKEFMALYEIVDIRMRMLKVDELKRIMGFPTDYILIGTQSEQKKFIGNAVEVNMAKALVETLAKCIRA